MHQYVDKPRLHANYSLTELIFVIVAKLRNFVKSIRKLRLCCTREPAIHADTTRNPCLHRHRRSFLRLRSFRCRSCHNHHLCHRHYRNFRRCFFPLFPGSSSAKRGSESTCSILLIQLVLFPVCGILSRDNFIIQATLNQNHSFDKYGGPSL